MRGRKPIPTRLHALAGNPSKRPRGVGEPKPEPARPTRPADLVGPSRTEWDRIVPELEKLGLLTKIDRSDLAGYCVVWGEMIGHLRTLRREGRTQTTASGYVTAHPSVAGLNTNLTQLRAFSALFGMSPAERSRVTAATPEEVDELEALLGGKAG